MSDSMMMELDGFPHTNQIKSCVEKLDMEHYFQMEKAEADSKKSESGLPSKESSYDADNYENRDIALTDADCCCESAVDLVKVPQSLTFVRSVVEGMFEAKIKIENLSSYLNVTYHVIPAYKGKFTIKNETGVLTPKSYTDVIILSNPSKIKDFGCICTSGGFTVFATPIYFKSQLQQKKINLLWKVYGSSAFPYAAAEVHKIEVMVPGSDSYLDDYNIIERAILGNFVARPRIKNTNVEREISPSDEKTFLRNWLPTESDNILQKFVKQEIRISRRMTKDFKRRVDSLVLTTQSFMVFSLGILMTAGIYAAAKDWMFHPMGRIYGSNGQELHREPNQWWKLY